MKCPYCEKEMEQGAIYSSYELAWTPGEKPSMRNKFDHLLGPSEETVVLGRFDWWKGSVAAAQLCRACRKVVIDYAD